MIYASSIRLSSEAGKPPGRQEHQDGSNVWIDSNATCLPLSKIKPDVCSGRRQALGDNYEHHDYVMFSPLIFKMSAVRRTLIHKKPGFLMIKALILSIFLWPYISVFCHELGHFVCAKLVGMSPYPMKVGSGFSISSKRFFGAQIELGIHLFSFTGETRAHFPTNWSTFKELKPKLIIYCMGGCLANSILLSCSIAMLAHTGFPIFLYIIVIEAAMIISAIVPRNILLYGRKHPNDAKQIFLILTKDYQQYYLTELQKYLTRMDGNLAGPYILLKNDTRTIELFVKAETELVYKHFDEAIALYDRLLSAPNVSGAERVYLLDILASILIVHGQMQYLTLADLWSQEAMKLAGHSKTVQGTRGAILIELGKYEEGMRMLFQITEPDNDPVDIAISSCYLAKAEHRLGNGEQAWSWLNLAEKAGEQVHEISEMLARVKQELSESLD